MKGAVLDDSSLSIDRGRGCVLVVDDEESVCDYITRALGKLGYVILSAGDGLEAIEVFKEHRHEVDLVILDLIMPRLSGVETFHSLRAISAKIPVVITSGYTKHDQLTKLTNEGARAFLAKPFTINQLTTIVAEHIRQRPL